MGLQIGCECPGFPLMLPVLDGNRFARRNLTISPEEMTP